MIDQKVKTELAQDLEVKKQRIKDIKQFIKQFQSEPHLEKLFDELIKQEHFEKHSDVNKWNAKYIQYMADTLKVVVKHYKQQE